MLIGRLRRRFSGLLREDKVSTWRALGATIGEGVFIGANVVIDEGFAPLLTIEDGVVISDRVVIMLHDSALNNVCGLPIKVGRVTLSKNAYVGVNATILCGVTIGQRALVGAGSVVVKDIPDETVAFGCPAQVQGTLKDFRERFEAAMTVSKRFAYWDIVPWRERSQVMTPHQIAAARRDVIRRVVPPANS